MCGKKYTWAVRVSGVVLFWLLNQKPRGKKSLWVNPKGTVLDILSERKKCSLCRRRHLVLSTTGINYVSR